MTGRSPGFVRRLFSLCRDVRGEGTAVRKTNAVAELEKRDLADIAAGVTVLPGAWNVETTDDDTAGHAGAWLRPQDGKLVPAFGITRADGVIMVRMARVDAAGNKGALVFGAFGSIVAALDAIHNDVAERLSRGHGMAAGVS